MIGIALPPSAFPAARVARTLPAFSAISRYDETRPYGMRAVALSTRSANP